MKDSYNTWKELDSSEFNNLKMDTKILLCCPVCDSTLAITHRDKYPDSSDRITGVHEYGLKDGFQCTSEECFANIGDITWIDDGDMFLRSGIPKWSRPGDLDYVLKLKYGTYYAKNSWHFHYEIGRKEIEKKTFAINIANYRFKFYPAQKGPSVRREPLDVNQYMPSRCRWKIDILKKDEEDFGYTQIILAPEIARFRFRKFLQNYKDWKRTSNQWFLHQAREIISPDRGFSKSSRWPYYFVNVALKFFHGQKRKEVIEAAKAYQNQ